MYYALCNLHRAHTNHTSFALDEHARQWRVSCTSFYISIAHRSAHNQGGHDSKINFRRQMPIARPPLLLHTLSTRFHGEATAAATAALPAMAAGWLHL